MVRGAIAVRDARPEDASALLDLWSDHRADAESRLLCDVGEVESSVLRVDTLATERLIVAVVDDEPVGVAHLRRAPISPIHSEDAVHVGYLHVLSGFRRRGIGKLLLEAAADWADEAGTTHILSIAGSNNREINRFLASLGMSQVAVVRVTKVPCLRGKLAGLHGKSVTSAVVAARRLTRRPALKV